MGRQNPVALPSKVCVSDRSFAGNTGSNSAGVMDVRFFVNVACRQIEVSAKGKSLVQKSPRKCVCVCVFICVCMCVCVWCVCFYVCVVCVCV
jgi:hypothetical protein